MLAAPFDEFEVLRTKLQSLQAEIKCSANNECFFDGKCKQITGKLPSLVFNLGLGDGAKYFEVPASKYFIETTDKSTG